MRRRYTLSDPLQQLSYAESLPCCLLLKCAGAAPGGACCISYPTQSPSPPLLLLTAQVLRLVEQLAALHRSIGTSAGGAPPGLTSGAGAAAGALALMLSNPGSHGQGQGFQGQDWQAQGFPGQGLQGQGFQGQGLQGQGLQGQGLQGLQGGFQGLQRQGGAGAGQQGTEWGAAQGARQGAGHQGSGFEARQQRELSELRWQLQQLKASALESLSPPASPRDAGAAGVAGTVAGVAGAVAGGPQQGVLQAGGGAEGQSATPRQQQQQAGRTPVATPTVSGPALASPLQPGAQQPPTQQPQQLQQVPAATPGKGAAAQHGADELRRSDDKLASKDQTPVGVKAGLGAGAGAEPGLGTGPGGAGGAGATTAAAVAQSGASKPQTSLGGEPVPPGFVALGGGRLVAIPPHISAAVLGEALRLVRRRGELLATGAYGEGDALLQQIDSRVEAMLRG